MSVPQYPVLLSAVEVPTGGQTIVYHDNTADRTATIAAGTYYLRGDGESGDLLAAVEAALEGAPSSSITAWTAAVAFDVDTDNPCASVTLSAPGVYTLKVTGTFDLAALGFTAEQGSSVGDVTSDVSCSCAWVSNQPYDTKEPQPRRSVEQHEAPEEGSVYTFATSDVKRDRSLVFNFIRGARAMKERNTSDPAASFESWWEDASDGRSVEIHLPAVSSGSALAALSTRLCTAVLHVDSMRALPLRLTKKGQALYGGEVRFVELSRP